MAGNNAFVAALKRTWLDPYHISHATIERGLRRHADALSGRVLDVGCGDKPYRRFFRGATQYLGTETRHTFAKQRVFDVVALGEALPFASGSMNGILCTEVLEHVPEPALFLMELYRVLAPGGAVLLTTPQTWGLHEEPYDFYRYTKYGLSYLFKKAGFDVLEVESTTGTFGTVGQRLSSFWYTRLRGSRVTKPLGVLGSSGIQLAFYAIDVMFSHQGDTLDWIVLARKPA
jgi:SAM-dependent methyltransferase